jgi:hypothetical protein
MRGWGGIDYHYKKQDSTTLRFGEVSFARAADELAEGPHDFLAYDIL